MRRKDKEVTSKEWMYEVLKKALYLELAMVTPEGEPYVVPVSFGVGDGFLVVHGAVSGFRPDCLRNDPRVCFNAVVDTEIVPRPNKPGRIKLKFRSVTGRGRVRFIDDPQEKLKYLSYLPHYTGNDVEPVILEKVLSVYLIEITDLTGKSVGYPRPMEDGTVHYNNVL